MCLSAVPSVLEPKLDPRRLQNVSIDGSIGIGTRARSKEVPKRLDPRQTVKQMLKSNLSLDKRSRNFRLQKSQSCSNTQPQVTQPQVVLASKGKMYTMRSVQTDTVPQTLISHAQTNTIPVAKSSTCTQTIFQMNHTSSQTDCIKQKRQKTKVLNTCSNQVEQASPQNWSIMMSYTTSVNFFKRKIRCRTLSIWQWG